MNHQVHPRYFLAMIAAILLLQGCGSNLGNLRSSVGESTPESIDELLSTARERDGDDAADLILTATEELLDAEDFYQAEQTLTLAADPRQLSATLQLRYELAYANIALQQQRPEDAVTLLTNEFVRNVELQTNALQYRYHVTLASSYLQAGRFSDAIDAYLAAGAVTRNSRSTALHDEIWNGISQLSDAQLDAFASNAETYESRGWIELARIARREQFNIKAEIDAIAQWRRTWNSHPATRLMPTALAELQLIWDQRPQRIALLLPLQTPAGIAIQEGFLSAYYQALAVSRDVPEISLFDTSGTLEVMSVYNDAVDSDPDLIIGPLDKNLVNQLQRRSRLPIPTLALNYADQTDAGPDNLFQFGLAPEDEMLQAANLAWQAGYRNAAIVTPQTDDYMRLRGIFSDIWQTQGGQVVSQASYTGENDYGQMVKHLLAIDSSEARAERLLDILPRANMEFIPRRRGDIDFIFLIANPRQGRQVKPTLAFYFAEDLPVYALSAIYDGAQDSSANRDLDGIVFTDTPWVLSTSDPLKAEITTSLRQVQGPLQRLRAMGVDSFRLYPLLEQLESHHLPDFQGTTGKLTMSPNRRIRRDLTVATFVDGVATQYLQNQAGSE